jgi:HEPN domain-containing protein
MRGAEVLHANGIFHLVCFIAQQVAEKALKAYLYTQGETMVTGHSVAALAEWAKEYDPEFGNLGSMVSPLDAFYITARYPNGLPASTPSKVFGEKTASDALDLARTALSFVAGRIG